jgi:hypothetical protein
MAQAAESPAFPHAPRICDYFEPAQIVSRWIPAVSANSISSCFAGPVGILSKRPDNRSPDHNAPGATAYIAISEQLHIALHANDLETQAVVILPNACRCAG